MVVLLHSRPKEKTFLIICFGIFAWLHSKRSRLFAIRIGTSDVHKSEFRKVFKKKKKKFINILLKTTSFLIEKHVIFPVLTVITASLAESLF